MNTPMKISGTFAGFGTTLLVGGIVLAGLLAPRGWNFLITGLLLFAFMLVLGSCVTGRPLGVLINERNLMSLSRFQMAMWTIVILSAYLAIALSRLKASVPDPLAIGIDWHLWALLGISTTSLVGTPLLLSAKKAKVPDPAVLPQTAKAFNEQVADVEQNREGLLYGNAATSDARLTDMFEGDELKNTAHLDLGKVQLFFFTLVALIAYGGTLFVTIQSTEPNSLEQFPVLSDGLIALLGISHAGHLTSKGITHTKTT